MSNPNTWTWRPTASRILCGLAAVAFFAVLLHVPLGAVDLTALGLFLLALAFTIG